ncbi:hypothetical protein OIV83_002158 [Microbotryomycetes sp. JL201]|nr:hypothetical protein OIV83_002158 [Microbotryomycetes sp. JL201]
MAVCRCHQITDSTLNGAINNSIHIAPAPLSPATPRLYVSNNDESIKVYDVVGSVPDFRAAKRRRTRTSVRWQTEEHTHEARRTDDDDDNNTRSDSPSSQVEERGTYDVGGQCMLERRDDATITFNTAINHCSVSPDGRRLVAVGDTNEIHLYDCRLNGDYAHVHSFQVAEDASFSTDWSQTGDKFAVASQDGSVNVFDVRALPPVDSGYHSKAPRTLAALRSTQRGPAGAVRKVKFSPGNRVESELLAFTEHRSLLHVVDARSFEECQIVEVPRAGSTSQLESPPIRHRPLPESNSRSLVEQLFSQSTPGRRRLIDRISLDAPPRTWQRQTGNDLGSRLNDREFEYTVEVLDQTAEDESVNSGWPNEEDEDLSLDREDEDARVRRSISQERRQALARAFEEDCPPDMALDNDRSRSSVPWTNYSRILPDPRARTSRVDHRTALNASRGVDSSAAAFPRSMLPTRSSGNDSVLGATSSTNRNLSGYSPLTSIPSYVSEYRDGTREVRYMVDGAPATSVAYGLTSTSSGYQPNSLYFPIDSTPSDLLGLDWNEQGTSLFVATEDRVWEWQVDTRARRSFGDYGFL